MSFIRPELAKRRYIGPKGVIPLYSKSNPHSSLLVLSPKKLWFGAEYAKSSTGKLHRLEQCFLVWTSWTAFKETSLKAAVLDVCSKSKNIN